MATMFGRRCCDCSSALLQQDWAILSIRDVDSPAMQCCLHPRCVCRIPSRYITADVNSKACLAGSLQSCNPNRVVLKKITLSGYPVRVHKLKAVVRWMFHAAEDVRWFRPLGLWTKRGRHGHIRVCLLMYRRMRCLICTACELVQGISAPSLQLLGCDRCCRACI